MSLRIRPLKLNADSDETVLSGIAKKSRAIADSTGYLLEFVFHQVRISNLSSGLTGGSSRYASSSDFSILVPLLRFLYSANSCSSLLFPSTSTGERFTMLVDYVVCDTTFVSFLLITSSYFLKYLRSHSLIIFVLISMSIKLLHTFS